MLVWQTISGAITIIIPALVILYDLLASSLYGRDATITAVVQRWAVVFPELPWVIAALFTFLWCHFFGAALMHGIADGK